jgi:hypothetical protein
VSTTVTVRKSPQGGESITVLKTGTDVTEVSKAHDYVLILLPDPKDSSKQLLGWVYKDALEPSESKLAMQGDTKGDSKLALGEPTKGGATQGTAGAANAKGEKPITCKAGEVKMQSDHDFCAKACREDADCKASGGLCDGEAKVIVPGGALDKGRYCVGSSQTTTTTQPAKK